MRRFWIALMIAGIAFVAVSVFHYVTRPSAGDAAPLFELASTEGKRTALEGFRGRTVLLHFWASWCGPCRDEFPLLSAFAEDRRGEDLAVLAVAEDDARSRPAMLAYVREQRPSFLVLMDDDGAIADAYESWSVPETFLIDREGTIRWRHAGPVDWNAPKNKERVERLIRGEP